MVEQGGGKSPHPDKGPGMDSGSTVEEQVGKPDSQPILEVGAEVALQELSVDHQKFVARDGLYNWTNAGNGDRT